MNPRSLIETLFGKETGITKDDIKNLILGKVNEGVLIDYKRIDNFDSVPERRIDQTKARSLIMRAPHLSQLV